MITPLDALPPAVRAVVAAAFPRVAVHLRARLPIAVVVASDLRTPAAVLRRAGFFPTACGHWAWAPTVN